MQYIGCFCLVMLQKILPYVTSDAVIRSQIYMPMFQLLVVYSLYSPFNGSIVVNHPRNRFSLRAPPSLSFTTGYKCRRAMPITNMASASKRSRDSLRMSAGCLSERGDGLPRGNGEGYRVVVWIVGPGLAGEDFSPPWDRIRCPAVDTLR